MFFLESASVCKRAIVLFEQSDAWRADGTENPLFVVLKPPDPKPVVQSCLDELKKRSSRSQ
jgi:hypothetical protein